MKSIFIILAIFSISCIQDYKLITRNKIGNYKLGSESPKNFDKDVFDLTFDANNKIVSIIVKSDEYRTEEGFGVGSNIDKIALSIKDSKKGPFTLSKGNTSIGNLGVKVIYNSILFVDTNNDELVDFVWIQKR